LIDYTPECSVLDELLKICWKHITTYAKCFISISFSHIYSKHNSKFFVSLSACTTANSSLGHLKVWNAIKLCHMHFSCTHDIKENAGEYKIKHPDCSVLISHFDDDFKKVTVEEGQIAPFSCSL